MVDWDESEALAQSLVGRTITRVHWFDASPKSDWSHHETCYLWLDDGRVMEFSSYGYDADGATIEEIEVVDVGSCEHCRKAHPASRVFKRADYEDPRRYPPFYAFCEDGNHVSWRRYPPEKGCDLDGE